MLGHSRPAAVRAAARGTRGAHTYATTLAAHDARTLVPAVHAALARAPAHSTLLYAISRDIPPDVLADIVYTMRKDRARTHLGVLSASLPVGESFMHSVAFAALTHAVPFRSTISGGVRIAVGRWPAQKELWQRGPDMYTRELDSGADWRALWGRENVDARLPEALEDAQQVGTVLLASDGRPQGVAEGLDARFPHAAIAGLIGARTPFATGREYTLIADGLDGQDGIFESGALGVALPEHLRIETQFAGLEPIGAPLAITGARGNIISTLEHANAAQQFLRLVTHGRRSPGADTRTLASHVSKDDEFVVAILEGERPALVARLNSGHPMRGTLSIDTTNELGVPGARMQLYRQAPAPPAPLPHTPQIVFLAAGVADASVPAADARGAPLELPHAMYVASDGGWLGRGAAQNAPLSRYTRMCSVPHARLIVHL